ncbi:PXA domain-containing protein [Gilbertella persicaria]|uniref:PXA domain-containing protein n=1 Tax=Gilbertella persicaria TaxID=101096 RepID=UPI0022203F25|nr:PXA domain-containing protein [Gilbertella persicaria]KAI8051053.1 PXA domain-containing protein [Gilbertella persicaria]
MQLVAQGGFSLYMFSFVLLAIVGLLVSVQFSFCSHVWFGLCMLLLLICALLALHTIVLYVYITYIVSPQVHHRIDTFKPLKFVYQSRPQEPNTVEPLSEHEELNTAFNTLLSCLMRDFIQSWYTHISADPSFSNTVDRLIRASASHLAQRLSSADLLHILLNRILPRITFHIAEFRAAEESLRGKSLERSVTQSDELDLLLASRFRQGKLHKALTTSAVTTKPTEMVYLRGLMERVLPLVIDPHELASGPVRVVVREIVSHVVLQPVLDMLADPDFWNQTIDSYLGKAIMEQKMVRQLREVLNRHSTHEIDQVMDVLTQQDTAVDLSFKEEDDMAKERKSPLDPSSFSPTSKKSVFGMDRTGKRTFQEFLKIIQEEKNLLDLKRVRNDIQTQIRKKKTLIADRDPEEIVDGEKVQDVMMYINRLGVAKKRVDKRIATLSGEQFDIRKSTTQLFSSRKQSTSQSTVGMGLRDILTNTSGLSYFMEFMDRRGDMVKLQFWLTVEGFNSMVNHPLETFLQDTKMVHDMYFTELAPHRLHVSDTLVYDLKQSIASAEASMTQPSLFSDHVRELGLRLSRIQQHVFWEIEKEHFPYFKRSDLYFKFLSSAPPLHSPDMDTRHSLDESTRYNQKTRPASIHESPRMTPETSSYFEERPRGHQRALSDSIKPKFFSFSNMFGQERPLSVPSSIKSLEDEDEFLMDMVVPNRLVRRNTVDAVEAELRSILDGNTMDTKTEPEEKPTKPTHSVLLLGGSQVKSSTALPVQNVYTLPSWTSSGGTNTISEIEHDSLESMTGNDSKSSTEETSSMTSYSSQTNVHFAPPGDLMLATKVQQLSEEIEKLTAQEAIVDALITKAESQEKLEELRILKKSKTMFRQELQQIQYQKSQYELQESENVLLPQRTQIHITSATIGSDKHGEFALYVIEIQQLGLDGNYASGWIVARRYSEFLALHTKLKELFPAVRWMEFPGRWPFIKLQKPLVETRRVALEKYLRQLVQDKEICASQEFRLFLSQQNIFVNPAEDESSVQHTVMATSTSSASLQSLSSPSVQNLQKSMADDNLQKKPSKGFMHHIYKTVAAGIDDILIGPSMLDLITQRLGEQVMEFSQQESPKMMLQNNYPEVIKEGITRFTEPLCDLFIEMFELKDKTNWLRRQAIVIIIQQILEGTIERKLRETVKYLGSLPMLVFYLNKMTDSLWPQGGPFTLKEPRKLEEKLQTREEANRKLSTWLPGNSIYF